MTGTENIFISFRVEYPLSRWFDRILQGLSVADSTMVGYIMESRLGPGSTKLLPQNWSGLY